MAHETNVIHRAFAAFLVTVGPPNTVTVLLDGLPNPRQATNGVFITDPASPDAPVYNGVGDYTLHTRLDKQVRAFDHIMVRPFNGVAAIIDVTVVAPNEIQIVSTTNLGAPLELNTFSIMIEGYEPMS